MTTNKKNPSISVIVPLYNVEPYIVDCLESVANQQYDGAIECVIVDDCGTDRSLDLARQFIDNYTGPIEFSIIRREKNGGLSSARNDGIRCSRGEYILFLDSDDELTETALSSLAAPLENKRYDFVIADYITTGSNITMPRLLLDVGAVEKDKIFISHIEEKWYMMACNKLCRRQFILDHSLYFKEGLIYEDNLWSFKLAYYASSMYVTRDICYIYKVRSGSITNSSNFKERIDALLSIYEELVNMININQLDVTPELWNYLQTFFLRLVHQVITNNNNISLSSVYKSYRKHKLYRGGIRLNGRRIRRYIRDFHLVLPVSMSILYMRFLLWASEKWDSRN